MTRTPSLRFTLAGVVIALLALAAPAGTHAFFSTPLFLSDEEQDASTPQVAVD